MSMSHHPTFSKVKSVITSVSQHNLTRMTGVLSKLNVGACKSTSYMRGSVFAEAFDKVQLRRRTLRLDSGALGYSKLKVTSNIQFFREDWGGITALRYFQNGEKIAAGFNSGELHIYKVAGPTGKLSHLETILKGFEGNHSISCIKFHPKSPTCMYAASTEGKIILRDLGDTNNINDYIINEDDNEIYSIDFTVDSNLVTAGKDATIRVYDLTTNTVIRELGRESKDSLSSEKSIEEGFHEKRVYCVRCHPEDPTVLVSGGWDERIKVWDLRMRKPSVRGIVGPFIFGDSIDICKGKLLTASCVTKSSLELWDLGSGFRIKNVDPTNKRAYLYGEFPYAAQFFKGDPSGDLILFGVGGLQIISEKESSILYLCEDDKPVTAIDSMEKRFCYGGKSNSVVAGDITMPDSDASLKSSTLLSAFDVTPSPSFNKIDTYMSLNK